MRKRNFKRGERIPAGESPFAPGGQERYETTARGDSWRPWLLAAATALFVSRPLYAGDSAVAGDGLPQVMLWLAIGAVWLLGLVDRPKFVLRVGRLDLAVLGLVGWQVLACLAVAPRGPRPATNMLWEWVGFGLGFFLLRQLAVGQRERRAMVAVMIALATALAGYGLYQFCYEMPATRAAYERDPDGMLRAAGMWYEPGSHQRAALETRLRNTEPLATFPLTNSLAGVLAPWLVIVVGIAAGGAGLRRKRLWVVGTVMGGCLVLTKSRSAYLATLLGLAALAAAGRGWRPRWRLIAGVVAAVAVVAALAGVAGGLDRELLSEAGKSLGYRVQYWQSTARMIADHPGLGVGPGQFQNVYTRYKLPEASEEVADPHNFLMEIWATGGTPAVLVFVAMLAIFFRRALNGEDCDSDEPGNDTHVYVGLLAGFFLAVPLGMMGSTPPGMAALVVGVPLAAAAVWLLRPWVLAGTLPPRLPALGAAVLLVNLLAAGGITMAAVVGTLWLLMAIGDQPRPMALPGRASWIALAVGLGLIAACYFTAYRPAIECQAAIRAAAVESRWEEQVRRLEHAAAADPWAADPWRHLCTAVLRRWQEQPSDDLLEQLGKCQSMAGKLDPQSAAMWLAFGDQWWAVHQRSRKPDSLSRAVDCYAQAVQRYPNDALCRARLAVALRAAGQTAQFQDEASQSLHLDEITPHADRKLPDELRQELERR